MRPVPRVTIDFGDGQRLERTLHGNVAFWFTTADGGAFDLLPGLPTRAVLFERCHQALDLHRRLAAAAAAGGDEATLANLVIAEHARPRPIGPMVIVPTGPGERTEGVVPVEGTAEPVADLRKSRVEAPIERELGLTRLDAEHDRRVRYPLAHALLARAPLASVDSLTHQVYASILGVDLRDPYLGLAPWVLGGEIGRSESAHTFGKAAPSDH